jgi:hypothetical protein
VEARVTKHREWTAETEDPNRKANEERKRRGSEGDLGKIEGLTGKAAKES